jgi:hypothetical protein
MGMQPTTTTTQAEPQATPTTRRVSADLTIGLVLLGSVIVGRLLWALTDGSFLTALGTR